MIYAVSVAVPVIDNSAAIAGAAAFIEAECRRAERALDFACLPFVQQDPLVRAAAERAAEDANDSVLYQHYVLEQLAEEHGCEEPTQETWDALTSEERFDMLQDYLESDCRTGMWEFNPWGSLIERNCPSYFPRRHH